MLYPTFSEFEMARITGYAEDGHPYFKRGVIVDYKKVKDYFGYKEIYTSVGRYEKISDYVASNEGKIRGYNGSVWYDWIIIDIDEQDPKGVKRFLEHLNINHNISLDHFWLWFSGNKGFHIYIPTPLFGLSPGVNLHHTIRKTVEKIAGGVINYDSSLYDKTQIVRLPYSRHGKSNLFKIPIYFAELDLPVSKIREMAQDWKKRKAEFIHSEYPKEPIDYLVELAKEVDKKIIQNNLPRVASDKIVPQYRKLCIYDYLEGTSIGNRDDMAIRLASHFKQEGFSIEIVTGILFAWNNLNFPSLSDTEVNNVIVNCFRGSYSYGCLDELNYQYCHNNCYLFRNRNGKTDGTVEKD